MGRRAYVVGYCHGDSTCGQRAIYTLGLTGIPIYNVNNNCATGSTALLMAKQFIDSGANTYGGEVRTSPRQDPSAPGAGSRVS